MENKLDIHEFLDACRNGDKEKVLFFLENDISPDSGEDVSLYGSAHTALITAIWGLWGNTSGDKSEIINILLAHGASVNLPDKKTGWTPLMHAARLGLTGVVKQLIEHGATIDLIDKDHHTALMHACNEGHFEAAKILLKHGASATGTEDTKEWPPINGASLSFNENPAIIQLLIDHGASVNGTSLNGVPISDSPLIHACGHKHTDTEKVRILIENGANVNCYDQGGFTPLICASGNGNLATVELLLKNNANINATDIDGKTALAWALERGHNDIAKVLKKHGAKE